MAVFHSDFGRVACSSEFSYSLCLLVIKDNESQLGRASWQSSWSWFIDASRGHVRPSVDVPRVSSNGTCRNEPAFMVQREERPCYIIRHRAALGVQQKRRAHASIVPRIFTRVAVVQISISVDCGFYLFLTFYRAVTNNFWWSLLIVYLEEIYCILAATVTIDLLRNLHVEDVSSRHRGLGIRIHTIHMHNAVTRESIWTVTIGNFYEYMLCVIYDIFWNFVCIVQDRTIAIIIIKFFTNPEIRVGVAKRSLEIYTCKISVQHECWS